MVRPSVRERLYVCTSTKEWVNNNVVLFEQLGGYGGKPQTNHPSSIVNRIRQGYRAPHGQHPTHKRTVETYTPSHRLGIGSECYHGGTDESSSSDQYPTTLDAIQEGYAAAIVTTTYLALATACVSLPLVAFME